MNANGPPPPSGAPPLRRLMPPPGPPPAGTPLPVPPLATVPTGVSAIEPGSGIGGGSGGSLRGVSTTAAPFVPGRSGQSTRSPQSPVSGNLQGMIQTQPTMPSVGRARYALTKKWPVTHFCPANIFFVLHLFLPLQQPPLQLSRFQPYRPLGAKRRLRAFERCAVKAHSCEATNLFWATRKIVTCAALGQLPSNLKGSPGMQLPLLSPGVPSRHTRSPSSLARHLVVARLRPSMVTAAGSSCSQATTTLRSVSLSCP
jgi:hypothetical protein